MWERVAALLPCTRCHAGSVVGVAVTPAVPPRMLPTSAFEEFTARTWKVYSVSAVRLGTVYVTAPLPPGTSVHVAGKLLAPCLWRYCHLAIALVLVKVQVSDRLPWLLAVAVPSMGEPTTAPEELSGRTCQA